jgi:hypothetical protein
MAGAMLLTTYTLIDLATAKGATLMKLFERSKPNKRKVTEVAQTTSTKAKGVARSTSNNVRTSAQNTIASAKDTIQLAYAQVDKRMKLGWDKTLTWLTIGTGIANTLLQKNMQKAQKNLAKAQKKVQKVQGPLQSNVKSSLVKTSDMIGKSTSKATDSLKQATTKAKEMQEAWQEQSAKRQRRRKRAKTVFRWGLISGVTLALLYSPMAGSEARQRLSKGWQQSYTYFRNRRLAAAG